MTERITSYDRSGLVFDVVDTGPIDGEPIVLLHGFPQRSSAWDEVAPQLHAAGLRTLALDQRGYSPGARPRRRRDYAAPNLVADVVALVDRLGRPVHLVGHDWGAIVGWMMAAHHPERVRTWTAVSVGHPAAFLTSMVTSTQALRSLYIAFFQLPLLPEQLLAAAPTSTLERTTGMTPAMARRFHEDIVTDGALRGGLHWYRALPFAAPTWFWSRVQVPTTVVWSDGDPFLGRAGAERSGHWVDADYEVVIIGGANHWLPELAPGPLADAVLDRVRRPESHTPS